MKKSNATTKRKQNKKSKGASNRRSRTGVVGSGGRNNSVVLNSMPVFNSSVRRRLVYYDTGSLNVTSGAMNTTVFSANGLYDPNISGIGHQPTGFDQMMVFYDHYVVTRCRATVNWFNASSGASAQVALSLNSSNSVPTDYISLSEGGYLVRDYVNSVATADAIKTSVLDVNIARFAGVDDLKDATDLWGTASANPSEQTYFNLSAWDFQGGSPTLRYEVQLEYEAWFLEPRKLTTSMNSALHKLIIVEERKVPSHTK